MSAHKQIDLALEQIQDYQFKVVFGDGLAPMIVDEPVPIGSGQGPSPVQLLVTAVANCMTDSLLFALRKFKQDAEPLRTEATGYVGRNEHQRQRVLKVDITIHLGKTADELQYLDRILGQFEGFCTVAQSVAQGLPVKLKVFDAAGAELTPADESPAA